MAASDIRAGLCSRQLALLGTAVQSTGWDPAVLGCAPPAHGPGRAPGACAKAGGQRHPHLMDKGGSHGVCLAFPQTHRPREKCLSRRRGPSLHSVLRLGGEELVTQCRRSCTCRPYPHVITPHLWVLDVIDPKSTSCPQCY